MLYMCVTSISIGFHMNGASTARKNASEMNAILVETPNIECYINKHSESMLAPRGHGAIEFKDISFAYPSRPDIEVQGINHRILRAILQIIRWHLIQLPYLTLFFQLILH